MAEKKTGIDKSLIRELANILNETDLTEIEVEQEDMRIRVSRERAPQYIQAPVPVAQPAFAATIPATASVAATPTTTRDPANVVTAPMVGTCYMAPAPGARPFIEVGATVKEGQTLLIIEAMKTMNQIPSPRSGVVKEILVDDGRPVEYGEAMIVLE
ncbi:acetyl-CoA carboxylase biotin carboxyl carrier protein [Metarhizobium album]|uniref:Biotin carboxyl carrier protein of acetyl-CoA carboxylase n=1 Tax=Metarhizobium album TaxID=2182425 RepID=A0A2U2DHU1_9HYPH|nr:acetyl-CoA carboxylase biotin carboxyl carrier protein [Rhizobium album]PWE52811.1 acetyl-CoA carboxylase biotin carboxyl carrier protein [Rhizobium album]